MDKKEVEYLSQMIAQSEYEIQQKLTNNKTHSIECNNVVILLGNTGAGKTTLSCIMSGKEVLVKPRGKKDAKLEFPGIKSGGKSITKIPNIMIDNENDIIFCDCPGFLDTDGPTQEIINSFVIDYLLALISNNDCKVKIMLVIGANETDAGRSTLVSEVFNRMEQMFSNKKQLKQGVGIIFTKSESEKDGSDYIDELYDNAEKPVDTWCEFFKDNEDKVFTLPKALRKDVDSIFEYEDKEQLIEFFKTNQITNPIHSISLSDVASNGVDKLKNEQREKLTEIITKIFEHVYELFSTETSITNINKWSEILQKFIKFEIHNVNELKFIIHDNLPNNDIISNYIKCLNEFEVLNAFIGRAIGENNNKRIQKIFRDKAQFAFSQLTNVRQHAISIEIKEKQIENLKILSSKQEQMVDNFKQQLKKQKEDSDNYITKMETTIKEMKNKQKEDTQKMKELEEKNDREMKKFREEKAKEIEQMKEKMNMVFRNDMIKKHRPKKIKATIPWQLIYPGIGIDDKELGGILKVLSEEVGGNIHEYGFIQISSNSINGEDFMPKNLVDFNTNNSYANEMYQNTYILYDFIDQRIQITSYIMKRARYSNVKSIYLQNWKMEVSNDNINWKIVDNRSNCDALSCENNICIFNLKQPTNDFYRYVRLQQTGSSSNDPKWNYIFGLNYIDFYGRLMRPQ